LIVRVVPSESFGAALQYFSGSKAHNVRLREIAVKAKLKLNEYGLFDDDTPIAGAVEEEIYQKRHIAVGIPSMYGRYKEQRFDSLRLTFRLESLARVLFEEMVAGLNLDAKGGQRLGQLRLAHAPSPRNRNDPIGRAGVLDPDTSG
jgi:hypothetical protein